MKKFVMAQKGSHAGKRCLTKVDRDHPARPSLEVVPIFEKSTTPVGLNLNLHVDRGDDLTKSIIFRKAIFIHKFSEISFANDHIKIQHKHAMWTKNGRKGMG